MRSADKWMNTDHGIGSTYGLSIVTTLLPPATNFLEEKKILKQNASGTVRGR